MTDHNAFFKANQEVWDQRTRLHRSSDFYNVAGFLSGNEVLTEIELSELGDVKGKTLLHLQCHFGLDTLAWARRGAMVTGLDFSGEAIAEARSLAKVIKTDAEFICGNLYDATNILGEKQFDIIFTSYGAICWLPDLITWAAIIRRHLKINGLFYIAEFHPVLSMFDYDFQRIQFAYSDTEPIVTESPGTYTGQNEMINGKEYLWNHSLADVINALIKNGLQIQQLNEYLFSPYPCFNNMVPAGERRWQIKGMEGKIPMVFSIKAKG